MLCERASRLADHEGMNNWPADVLADEAISEAESLLGTARYMRGIACPECWGIGHRTYASTSGWRGGIGGMSLTDDICDKCWGTGRTDKTGPNLRKLLNETRHQDR